MRRLIQEQTYDNTWNLGDLVETPMGRGEVVNIYRYMDPDLHLANRFGLEPPRHPLPDEWDIYVRFGHTSEWFDPDLIFSIQDEKAGQ